MRTISRLLVALAAHQLFILVAAAQAPDYIAEVSMYPDPRFSTSYTTYRETSWSNNGTGTIPGPQGTYSWTQTGSASSGSVTESVDTNISMSPSGSNQADLALVNHKVTIYAKNQGTVLISVGGSVSGSVSTTLGSPINGAGFSFNGSNLFNLVGTNGPGDSLSTSASPPSVVVGSANISNGCSGSTTTTYSGTTYYKAAQINYSPGAQIDNRATGTADSTGSLTFTPGAPSSYQNPLAIINGPYVGGVLVTSPGATGLVSFTNGSYDPDDGTNPGDGICTYTWALLKEGSSYASTNANNPSFNNLPPGHYTLQLTIKDNEGVTANASKSFIVHAVRREDSQDGDDRDSYNPTSCTRSGKGQGNGKANTPGDINAPTGGDLLYGMSVKPRTGNAAANAWDPVTTRGYPLKNDIRVNSYRRYSGLFTSMGNAEFTYAMRLIPYAGGGTQMALIDAGGAEYDFGPVSGPFAPEAGVFSVLSANTGGYLLSGAGAPGNANQAGNYSYQFDGTGLLQTITDPSSNVQQITYSGGNPTQVDDLSSGRSITFGYTSGKISTVTEGGGTIVRHLSYTSGLLTGIEERDASNTLLRSLAIMYNADGTIASTTRDGDSATAVTFSYTDSGTGRKLADMTWPGSGGTRLNYFESPGSGAVARTSSTSVGGGVTYYDYDSTGNLVRIIYPLLYGQSPATTVTMGYNSGRKMTSWGDGIASLTMTYNSLGLLTGLSDNASRSWTYSYSGKDLTGISDAIGTLYSLTYGDSSNPHSPTILTDASSNSWTYTYNAYGQTLTATPPSGAPTGPTTYAYDETSSDPAYGWLASITNGAGDVTTFDSYSPLGDVLSLTTSPASGVNETVQYTYDALRRLRQVTQPDTTTESYTFTGKDLSSIEDEAGTVSDFSYCPTCGKLTGAIYPLSKGLVWNLNSDFAVTSFVDARNNSTTYNLGIANEPKQIVYPDGLQLYTYAYRRPGEPQHTGPSGFWLKHQYDNAGRETGVSLTDDNTYQISTTFRADDQPSAITDEVGGRTISYLTNRWLDKVTYDFTANGLSAAQEVSYGYNSDGTVSTVTWKNAGTTVASWSYSYDGAGRLSQISNSFSETTNFTYDGAGKLLTQSNQNGTSRAITYNDARGWPTLLEEKAGGTDFASYALTYDSGSNTVGNLTGVTELDTSTMAYGYDALYRLTSEARTVTNTYSKSYGYDVANNVTSVGGSTFATYDNSNKFSTISSGSKSYDSYGNLASGSYTGFSVSGFVYDRRFKATSAGSRVNIYNKEGLRGATRASTSGSPYTFFIYDGERIIGEINSSTGTIAAYTWGPGGIVSERILSGTPKSLWYHFGPQGETRQLTNSSASVVDTYRYTAYGVPLGSTGSDSNPFQYGGKFGYYTDATVTGAILAGQRWYSPGLFRWMTRDPISFDGGDNQYAYVSGNPVRWIDAAGEAQRQSTRFSSPIANRGPLSMLGPTLPHMPNGGDQNMICGALSDPLYGQCVAACASGYEYMSLWCSANMPTPQLWYMCEGAALVGGVECEGFCLGRFYE